MRLDQVVTTVSLLLAASTASPLHTSTPLKHKHIVFQPCGDKLLDQWQPKARVECATFKVPMDYTNPLSNDKVELHLNRIPAQIKKPLGTIFVNFGGPGQPCRESLVQSATLLLRLSGGAYDLVTFDPRGTHNDFPFVCKGADIHFADATTGNITDAWQETAKSDHICMQEAHNVAGYVGTPYTARDTMAILDALPADGKLRYWGFSYGTVLGATLAAMFPDRVEQLVLDGIENVHNYYHALSSAEGISQVDHAVTGFFKYCVEAGEWNCELAQFNMTAAQLEIAFWSALDRLKPHRLEKEDIVYDYYGVKNTLYHALYNSRTWPKVAKILTPLLAPDGTTPILNSTDSRILSQPPATLGDVHALQRRPLASLGGSQAFMGIYCGDQQPRAAFVDGFMPTYLELLNSSRIAGNLVAAQSMECALWPGHAREEPPQGLGHIPVSKSVLILTNDNDPITSVASARNLSSSFPNSAVLELVEAYGHTSLNTPSACADRAIINYWLTGSLPSKGTRCEVEWKPFENVTWPKGASMDLAKGAQVLLDLSKA